MRSKVFIEILFFFSLLLGAFLIREKPGQLESIQPPLNSSTNSSVYDLSSSNSSAGKDELSKLGNTDKVRNGRKFLAKRNPFAPEGSYSDILLPENPYTLLATLNGNPKRALIKIFTGEVQTIKEGDVLIDGAKVLKIKEKSVIIDRLGKKSELQLFNIEVEKWQIKK